MKRFWYISALAFFAVAVFPADFNAGETNVYYLAQATSSQPRGYSSAQRYLAEVQTDPKNGFEINPPAGWYVDKKSRRHAMRLSSRSYDAFIIIDVVPVSTDVSIDRDFEKFITEKNLEVKKTIPGFEVQSNRKVKLRNQYSYRTEAIFKAGPNPVLMGIYYVPTKTRVFMVTTICPEVTAQQWEPILSASVKSFTTLE